MKGRKPKPPEVHELNGNPSRLKLKELKKAQVKIGGGLPQCPSYLNGAARTEWRRVAPILARAGLLTTADRAVLTAYVSAWADLVEATKVITAEGHTYKHRGVVKQRPEVSIAQKAREQLRQICAEFGLTPSSRSRLSLPDKKNPGGDPLEEMLDKANAIAAKVLK